MSEKEFLNSWKEVAQYVGRSERTIQRWERYLGFPVHRPAGKLRSSVIALPAEIDKWIKGTPTMRASEIEEPQAPGPIAVQPAPEGSPRVGPLLLCIADQGRAGKVRIAFLEAQGYRVLTSRDGRSGVALFEQHRVDLVVLETGVKDMEAEVVLRMLKRSNSKIPVVVLSGEEELSVRVRQLADSTLTKAAGATVLLSTIQSWVGIPPKLVAKAVIRMEPLTKTCPAPAQEPRMRRSG